MALPAASQEDAQRLRLIIESPARGSRVGGEDPQVFVAGRAVTGPESRGWLDVVLVIDTSKSTSAPSGADVDGDGYVGREMGARRLPLVGRMLDLSSDDPGDSILAAEIEAAKTLLDQLDPSHTRVGIVAFSGDGDSETRDAFTAVPLTHRYDKVEHGLDRLLEEGPHGRTNLLEAIDAAATELVGTLAALSEPRPGARRVTLLMTDGRPTLPIRRSSHRNAALAIEAARRAADEEIRIDTFAIGEEAQEAVVLREIAHETRGRFTPVAQPQDLMAVFQRIRLAEIEWIELRNQTTGVTADLVFVDADGRFSALVTLGAGPNRIDVRARSTLGQEVVERLIVERDARAPAPTLDVRLLQRRTRLLETGLERARGRRLEIQAERDDRVRGALARDIESARGQPEVPARSVEVIPEP